MSKISKFFNIFHKNFHPTRKKLLSYTQHAMLLEFTKKYVTRLIILQFVKILMDLENVILINIIQ